MRQSLPTPQCALIFTQEEEKKYEEEQAATKIELLIKDDDKLKAKLNQLENEEPMTKVQQLQALKDFIAKPNQTAVNSTQDAQNHEKFERDGRKTKV